MAPSLSGAVQAAIRFPFELTLLLLPLPVYYLLPSSRPHPSWTFRQSFGVTFLQFIVKYISLLNLGPKLSLLPGPEGARFQIASPADASFYRKPLDDEKIKPEQTGMTWYKDVPSKEEVKEEGFSMVLHIHGGACVVGDGREKDMGFLAKTLIREMGVGHVCCPQYRLASPEGPDYFPAAVQDVVTTWIYLTKEMQIPGSKIVLSGDSAGGNLALALLRYIHEHGLGLDLQPPTAVALWSPWVDVHDAAYTDARTKLNYKTDYVSNPFARWGSFSYTDNARIDPKHPYVSPVHTPFYSKIFENTPVFLQTGEAEVLYYDDMALGDWMEDAGWKVTREISAGCPHDIMAVGPVIGFKNEAAEAARKCRQFLEQETALSLRK